MSANQIWPQTFSGTRKRNKIVQLECYLFKKLWLWLLCPTLDRHCSFKACPITKSFSTLVFLIIWLLTINRVFCSWVGWGGGWVPPHYQVKLQLMLRLSWDVMILWGIGKLISMFRSSGAEILRRQDLINVFVQDTLKDFHMTLSSVFEAALYFKTEYKML